MAAEKITIGNVEVLHLSDGTVRFKAQDFYPEVPTESWGCRCSLPEEAPQVELNLGCYLVRSGGRTILVDTGMGPLPLDDSGSEWGNLMSEMTAVNLDASEIDTVFLTHLHFDHVGWNTSKQGDRYVPTFQKARYLVSSEDWDFFRSGSKSAEGLYRPKAVEPLDQAGVLDTVDGEHNLTDEVKAIPTPGHTPGHMSVLVSSKGEKGLILGDAAHHPMQVHETGWKNTADVDGDAAQKTRESVMSWLEEEGLTLAAGHFPAPGFGKVVRLEGKRYFQALL